MAKASMKLKGKEVGPATVYAKNDTGEAKMRQAITKPGNGVDKLNMSTGNYGKDNYEPMNKHGEIKIRGTGAATKGTKARGPMA
jgi:hypothetical protein